MLLPNQSAPSPRCFAATRIQVDRMVNQLKAAGFVPEEISVEYPYRGANRPVETKPETKAVAWIMAGAGIGGVVGLGLGWLAIAGPLGEGKVLGCIGGMVLGMILGAIPGGLIGRRIQRDRYWRHKAGYSEGRVEVGNILISVNTGDAEKLRRANQILTGSAVPDTRVTVESSAPTPDTNS